MTCSDRLVWRYNAHYDASTAPSTQGHTRPSPVIWTRLISHDSPKSTTTLYRRPLPTNSRTSPTMLLSSARAGVNSSPTHSEQQLSSDTAHFTRPLDTGAYCAPEHRRSSLRVTWGRGFGCREDLLATFGPREIEKGPIWREISRMTGDCKSPVFLTDTRTFLRSSRSETSLRG